MVINNSCYDERNIHGNSWQFVVHLRSFMLKQEVFTPDVKHKQCACTFVNSVCFVWDKALREKENSEISLNSC